MAAKVPRKRKPPENENGSKKRYKGEGRVAFLACLPSIREMIQAGWPLQAVYDRHEERLEIQYMQFHRYVAQFIKARPVKLPIEEEKPEPKKYMGIKSFKKGPSDPDPRDVW
jgi:hypothetical protein